MRIPHPFLPPLNVAGLKLKQTDKVIFLGYTAHEAAFRFYNLVWKFAIPLLRRNQRLAEGLGQRTLEHGIPPQSDLWIQAASAGESYLAWSLLKNLRCPGPVRVLTTSNTRQGMDILEQIAVDVVSGNSVNTAYFPFDRPDIMAKAVRYVCPKIMVLLETEIWPGLLFALKKCNCKILIINGRISEKSMRHYMLWPSFWRSLRPDRVLAVSPDDAERFSLLFGSNGIEVMRNMKFDGLDHAAQHGENPLEKMFPVHMPLLVLGSTGDEEEVAVEKIISQLRDRHPDVTICLFPRHMHRIRHWKKALVRLNIPWKLRSEISAPVQKPLLILWDTFGELSLAYELASAAFVGGSLAPLGGQNFLEALSAGVIPVIGPSWESFHWVGREIMERGFVRIAGDWQEAAHMLSYQIRHPPSGERVREAASEYIRKRQGGTARACQVVAEFLSGCQS